MNDERISDAERLACQEATIMKMRLDAALKDKRIAEQQVIIGNLRNSVGALQRKLDSHGNAHAHFRGVYR